MIGLSRFLLLRLWATCYPYTALYYLHLQILVNFVFSYDLILVFKTKALLFISVIFKSYSPLSHSRQK